VKKLVALIFCLAFWLMPSCASDPIVGAVQAKYPNCDVLKVDKTDNVVKITLQCPGNRIKEVTMFDKS
jgi:hypothetical protein